MKNQKITQMSFAKVYPLYIAKGRSRSDYYLADWV